MLFHIWILFFWGIFQSSVYYEAHEKMPQQKLGT